MPGTTALGVSAAVLTELKTKGETELTTDAGGRLTTAGFGASRPKATNDTLEGRALNRRVELVRR
jgi:flagellar motor protein MotB